MFFHNFWDMIFGYFMKSYNIKQSGHFPNSLFFLGGNMLKRMLTWVAFSQTNPDGLAKVGRIYIYI